MKKMYFWKILLILTAIFIVLLLFVDKFRVILPNIYTHCEWELSSSNDKIFYEKNNGYLTKINLINIDKDSLDYYEINDLSLIPEPDIIILYFNGKTKRINRNSRNFKNIIEMNIKRFKGTLYATYKGFFKELTLKNDILIEYKYINDNNSSIYFSLLKDPSAEDDYMGNYVCIRNFQDFRATAVYYELDNSAEMVEFIKRIMG